MESRGFLTKGHFSCGYGFVPVCQQSTPGEPVDTRYRSEIGRLNILVESGQAVSGRAKAHARRAATARGMEEKPPLEKE